VRSEIGSGGEIAVTSHIEVDFGGFPAGMTDQEGNRKGECKCSALDSSLVMSCDGWGIARSGDWLFEAWRWLDSGQFSLRYDALNYQQCSLS
jgi:hypothetical protein